MSFWNQVIELLSQSPGSLIYHFGVLFAIEAALGMAAGHFRRPALRRVVLAAGGMLATRLLMMTVALLDSQGLVTNPVALLPPLERVVDTIGVWLLIWAMLPLSDKTAQWSNSVAGGGVILLMVLYFFSAAAWRTELAHTAGASYNGSSQASIWEAIQVVSLGAACVAMIVGRGRDWILRIGILAVLWAVHVVHILLGSPGGNVAGWARLGQLVAYPLLTVSTYRQVVGELLEAARAPSGRSPAALLEQLKRMGAIAVSFDSRSLSEAAVRAVSSLSGAQTVALFSLSGANLAQVDLYHVQGRFGSPAQRSISLDKVPVLRRVATRKQAAFLRPGDTDDLSRKALLSILLPAASLGVGIESSLLVEPVCCAEELCGLLVVQVSDGRVDATERLRAEVGSLAAQLGNGLIQVQAYRRLQSQVAQLERDQSQWAANLGEELGSELKKARQVERDLLRQLDAARQELARAERDVRGLDSWIELSEEQRARIELLQRQLDAVTAEMEGKTVPSVSPDRPAGSADDPEQALLVAQGVRGPLASISGYTDLLLGESVGAIGELQRLFLQRIKASTERVRVLLDNLMQTAAIESDAGLSNREPVQLADVVQVTTGRLAALTREKGIVLRVDLAEPLPLLELNRDLMEQIMLHLLSNACQVTVPSGEVIVSARYEADDPGQSDESVASTGYLFVSVSDAGGGVPLRAQPYVFDRRYRAEHPSIAGLGDTSMALPLVRELLQSQGGRIWVESEPELGSTFSVVLPAPVAQRPAS